MCFQYERDWLYMDHDGDPLRTAIIEQMPVPDPQRGWYPLSKPYMEDLVIHTEDEVFELSMGGEYDFSFGVVLAACEPGTTLQDFLPRQMQLCEICKKYFSYSESSLVEHCDQPGHRRLISQHLQLPTVIGVSWRVPIPASKCEICIEKRREGNALGAIFESLSLSSQGSSAGGQDSKQQSISAKDEVLSRFRKLRL